MRTERSCEGAMPCRPHDSGPGSTRWSSARMSGSVRTSAPSGCPVPWARQPRGRSPSWDVLATTEAYSSRHTAAPAPSETLVSTSLSTARVTTDVGASCDGRDRSLLATAGGSTVMAVGAAFLQWSGAQCVSTHDCRVAGSSPRTDRFGAHICPYLFGAHISSRCQYLE